eukprot:m.191504 g.191504  ORF g.191504 m.191504 type:complete len:52 (-) comp14844_c0_seq3:1841-1996(-)
MQCNGIRWLHSNTRRGNAATHSTTWLAVCVEDSHSTPAAATTIDKVKPDFF